MVFLRYGISLQSHLTSMTVSAYAKINIGLHILGKRSDGYHDIETVFHRINIFDTLTFSPADRIIISSTDPAAPADETNLCFKAAELLRKHYSVQKGANIELTKQIPVGAGLGGGSSDAAATLRALSKLWDLPADAETLINLSSQLGSDVAFFSSNYQTAFATGRGEILEPFALKIPYWIVTAFPDIHVSTAWAYGNLVLRNASSSGSLKASVSNSLENPAVLKEAVRNDFEPVVFETFPAVRAVRDTLYDRGAVFSQLSGSGSAVYGFFQEEPNISQFGFPSTYRVFTTPPHFNPITSANNFSRTAIEKI